MGGPVVLGRLLQQLNHGAGQMPVLGFGTPIPNIAATISATGDALEAGLRHFDCAERHRNEREVGPALQQGPAAYQTKVSSDTFVQLLQFCSSGLMKISASRPRSRESLEAILVGAEPMILRSPAPRKRKTGQCHRRWILINNIKPRVVANPIPDLQRDLGESK